MKKLPLPSPRSPVELDRKILAYARRAAPAKNHRLPLWLSGLATASVLGVAIMLTTRHSVEVAPSVLKPRPGPTPKLELNAAAPATKTPRVMAKPKKSALRADTVAADTGAPPAGFLAEEMATAGQEVPRQLLPAPILAQLEHIIAWHRAGEEEKANAAYRQLRASCPKCALPASLKEAARSYLIDPPPEP